MKRSTLLIFFVLPLILFGQQQRQKIDFETVAKEAAALIQKSEPRTASKLPKALKNLNYESYQNIRFRPSEALWWNEPSPFRVEFFHLGYIFREPVKIFEISDTHVQEIPFLKDAFDYEKSGYEPRYRSTPSGYAGIRVKYPLNRKDIYDELIVFQGASYFRALGQGQAYGLSLHGLAMNTLGEKESFPHFTKLWLKKPESNDAPLQIYALLEGEKVTGAYEFKIRPDGITFIDVRARLYFRDGGAGEVGVAPITSMFVFGENTTRHFPNWRPEVHDSDGVMIHADREWTWHPLENIPGRYHKKFPVAKLRGFGLMQRDRAFESYKDLDAKYEKRPSAWVEPQGNWPTGSIVLHTLGTDNEAKDNVTLFWQPDLEANASGPLDLQYTLSIRLKDPPHELAKVLETRIGQSTLLPQANTIMVEFARPESIAVQEIAGLSLGFDSGGPEILGEPSIQYNSEQDRIRALIHLRNESPIDRPIELSAQLLRGGHQVSEKWSYTWKP
jgi:glucans biosynthesis protein